MDKRQIQEYKKIAKFLSDVLGDKFEIVLHNITDQGSNIITIYNPLSKRTQYSAESEFVRDIINSKEHEKNDSKHGFKIQTKENKVLYGSTFFIKEDMELVGMLCINSDKSDYERIINSLLKLGGLNKNTIIQGNTATPKRDSKNIAENLTEDIVNIVADVIGDDILRSNLVPNVEQKKEIVGTLYEKGIFNVKGAIQEVARLLKISEPSVYRYMSEFKNQGKQDYMMFYI